MSLRLAVPVLVCLSAAGGGAAAAVPPGQGDAGPATSYTDAADDAYRTPVLNQPAELSDAGFSQPALDLLEVGFAPVPSPSGRARGYTVTMRLKGAASPAASYVSSGEFTSQDRTCRAEHVLTPGQYALLDVSCGAEGHSFDLVSVDPVALSSGGTVLSATFDNRHLPKVLLDAGATLHPLSAVTCWKETGGAFCPEPTAQDLAGSQGWYRLA